MGWYFNNGGLYDQAHTAVATAGADPSTAATAAASSAHTSSLAASDVSADFVWDRGYAWYPDTPGAYPESKMEWYYNAGGLYDQAHADVATAAADPSTTAAGASNSAHTTALTQWDKSYTWYPDTPGAYPEGKMGWYFNNGGLYDQSHALALVPPVATGSLKPQAKALPPTPEQGKFVAEESAAPLKAAPGKKATPASPGHLLMCGHACLLGAMEATGKLVQKQDAKNWLSAWKDDFSSASTAAAEATSPVGGYVMRTHIMA